MQVVQKCMDHATRHTHVQEHRSALQTRYSKELSLRNQPLETQRWISPEFLGNRLAGPSVSKSHTTSWKLSAGFGPGFLETGWLAQEVRFPTLSSLLYLCKLYNARIGRLVRGGNNRRNGWDFASVTGVTAPCNGSLHRRGPPIPGQLVDSTVTLVFTRALSPSRMMHLG